MLFYAVYETWCWVNNASLTYQVAAFFKVFVAGSAVATAIAELLFILLIIFYMDHSNLPFNATVTLFPYVATLTSPVVVIRYMMWYVPT